MAGVTCLTFHPTVILVEGSFLGEKVDAKTGVHPALTHVSTHIKVDGSKDSSLMWIQDRRGNFEIIKGYVILTKKGSSGKT